MVEIPFLLSVGSREADLRMARWEKFALRGGDRCYARRRTILTFFVVPPAVEFVFTRRTNLFWGGEAVVPVDGFSSERGLS